VILCSNPREQYLAHRTEIDAAIDKVLTNGRYILGPEVEAFEKEFAQYCGVKHAVGVGSGTEALHVALAAMGITNGDEVITTAHTAVATATAIRLCGATPVFADIDPKTWTLDPRLIEQAVTPKTKAIVPVHIYGQPADLAPILELGVPVLEDCAQAHGAKYGGRRVGSMGVLGAFSFYPTKNLGAIGDGGAVVTDSDDLARRMRLLREYGWAERYISSSDGWNSRLDELQAAILRVKLRHLDDDNARRRAIAKRYDEALGEQTGVSAPHAAACSTDAGVSVPHTAACSTDAGVSAPHTAARCSTDTPVCVPCTPVCVPFVREGVEHVYHLYVVTTDRRDELQQHLRDRGIGALVHYPVAVHKQPAYATNDSLPNTERAARTVLSLPMYPELTDDDQQAVIDAVRTFAS
jgi:dTDP-4-amino-4,6-dideoxygalactose transaminase